MAELASVAWLPFLLAGLGVIAATGPVLDGSAVRQYRLDIIAGLGSSSSE